MKTRLETIALVSLLASGLLCSDIKSVAQVTPNSHPTVAEASAFMEAAEKELLALNVESARATWVQETYITDDTIALNAEEADRLIARQTELIHQGQRFEGLKLPDDLARKFLLLKLSIGLPAPSDPALRAELTKVAAGLDAAYGRGKYCPGGNQSACMGIDDIDLKMAKDRDPKELEALWVGWHHVGAPMRTALCAPGGAFESGCARTGFRGHRRAVARGI